MKTVKKSIRRELNEQEIYMLERACAAAQMYFKKFGCRWPELLPGKNYPSIETIRKSYLGLVWNYAPGTAWASCGELLVLYLECEGIDEWNFAVVPVVILERNLQP